MYSWHGSIRGAGALRRVIVVAATGVLALTGSVATLAGAASAAPAAVTAAPAGVTTVGTGLPGRVVALPTGELVRAQVDAKGRSRMSLMPTDRRLPQTYRTVTSGKHQYVVPRTAGPYLGRLIDLALFDVAALPTLSSSTRIPVRLTYTTAAAPSVPGVTITSSAAGAASGYLTPASARAFGAALAAKYAADAAAHFPPSTTIFGLTGLRAAASGPIITPQFPMRTLIVKVLDNHGAPALPDLVVVTNMDAGGRYQAATFTAGGLGRVSVPVGNYAVDAFVALVDTTGTPVSEGLVSAQDYVVATQNQTVTVDARAVTSPVTVTAPSAPILAAEVFEVDRTTADGLGGSGFGLLSFDGSPLTVQPLPPSRIGTVTSSVFAAAAGSAGTAPVTYNLGFPGSPNGGVPANQNHVVTAADLAPSDHRFHLDQVGWPGSFSQMPVVPGQSSWGLGVAVDPAAGVLHNYVNVIPGAVWGAEFMAFSSTDGTLPPLWISDGFRVVSAGGTVPTYDWGRGPLVSNVPVATDGDALIFGSFCNPCRNATGIGIGMQLTTDSTPGHGVATWASPTTPTVTRARLYQDGVLVYDQPNTGWVEATEATSAVKTYRMLLEVNRAVSAPVLSTSTVTDVTFRSAPGAGPAMPAGQICPFTEPCTVPALLRASVSLPVDWLGRVPVGSSSVTLTLGHVAGAADPAIASGTVEIRRPGGAWTALPTTATGAGSYRATVVTTAADVGTAIDLRFGGTDAAGGILAQTALAAFGVTP